MPEPVWDYVSSVPGAAWPAVPGPQAAALLAMQSQFERSQWLPPERLLGLQLRQLDGLVRHAYATVPYYRDRWRGLYEPGVPLTRARFDRLPVLERADLQAHFEALRSERLPAGHGNSAETRSSGSTGAPVRALSTELAQLMWRAVVVREHAWHRRELGGRLAAIRQGVQRGESPGWGPATDGVLVTGPSVLLPVSVEVGGQLKWLKEQSPAYLLTYPSNLEQLARRALLTGLRLPGLREARTLGEVVTPELRALCREAWGVPVVDAYSAQETGYLALQCPDHEHYHVQSETVRVEVLDERGAPAAPGASGRVVVTPLHNFAMPLVRYAVGDYAEAGAACPCGRGLPVLRCIHGRTRNTLVLADGRRYWPSFGSRSLNALAPVLQHQFVQMTHDLIEARLVTARPLTVAQEAALRSHIQSRLPARFEIRLVRVDGIPRSASGKFEDFISEVAAPVTGAAR